MISPRIPHPTNAEPGRKSHIEPHFVLSIFYIKAWCEAVVRVRAPAPSLRSDVVDSMTVCEASINEELFE